MIGSLMSRMGMAQKLSVAQLKQAVQDGSIPAYIGVPMIQDKLKQQQEAQAGKQAPAQPPVAEQVLAAAGQEERGIDSGRSNLEFSQGGIAYALGGDVDSEDYDDYMQQAQDEEDLQLAELMGDRAGIDSVYESKEPSYVNKTPSVGIKPTGQSEYGIKAPALDTLISHILKKESGNKDYDEKGNPLTSSRGAKYAMQVMPETARDPGFGIAPAKDESPAEYNRVGRELAAALLNKYGDPKLAAAAYNWGSGNVDKWLKKGADESMLPKETQGYLVGANFAEGGIASIAKYADGDLVKSMFKPGEETSWDATDNLGIKPGQEQSWDSDVPNFGIKPGEEKSWETTPSDKSINSPGAIRGHENEIHPDTQNWGSGQSMRPEARDLSGSVSPEAAPATPSAFDQWLSSISEEREALKSQKDEDKYLSLLASGLGMLKASGDIQPGKVHTAAGDIGAGGIEGLGFYATLAKQRAAERAALNKEYGTGLYRQELARTTGGNKAVQQALDREKFEEQKRINYLREREFNIGALDKLDQGLRSRWIQENKNSLDDEETKKQKQDQYVYNNPSYKNAWKRAHPDMPLPEVSGGNVMKFDKDGNPIK